MINEGGEIKFHAVLAQDLAAIWNHEIVLANHNIIKGWVWYVNNTYKYEVCNVTDGMRKAFEVGRAKSLEEAKDKVFEYFNRLVMVRLG